MMGLREGQASQAFQVHEKHYKNLKHKKQYPALSLIENVTEYLSQQNVQCLKELFTCPSKLAQTIPHSKMVMQHQGTTHRL